MTDRHTEFVIANTIVTHAAAVPEIALHLATEVTPLWQASEETLQQNGLPPPYWAFAWPGGQAFARLMLDKPELVRGRTILDFAAGSGIAAIAAVRSGAARAVASEIDDFALAAVKLNADLNGTNIYICNKDLLIDPPTRYDIILAGDVCYERPMASRVLAWLDLAVSAGIEVLVADPGRAYLPGGGLTELGRYDIPTSLDLENRKMMTTVIYRYAPQDSAS
ncbi:MAG TPA: 50S ribosomal protein L11 methyltransferase [Alphaproteobacteria bacterium]|nr:50S ribosomal protein L11 methyltransferase [Alphaproteobacteria bacterium]